MAQLVIIPALILGAIVGLVELFFVHSDEVGMGWFKHGLHAFPFTVLFVFINMNVGWVLGFIPGGIAESMVVDIIVRLVVAIIAMVKIQTAAAIAGRVGERIHHTIIIGLLILLLPYIWMFAGPYIPLPDFSIGGSATP